MTIFKLKSALFVISVFEAIEMKNYRNSPPRDDNKCIVVKKKIVVNMTKCSDLHFLENNFVETQKINKQSTT